MKPFRCTSVCFRERQTHPPQNVLDLEALCASNVEISYKINDTEYKELHYHDDSLQIPLQFKAPTWIYSLMLPVHISLVQFSAMISTLPLEKV